MSLDKIKEKLENKGYKVTESDQGTLIIGDRKLEVFKAQNGVGYNVSEYEGGGSYNHEDIDIIVDEVIRRV